MQVSKTMHSFTLTYIIIYILTYVLCSITLHVLFIRVYIEEVQLEGKKMKEKSLYPVISRRNLPCAMIINNTTFPSKPGLRLKKRSWSQSDVDKIETLGKNFGIPFTVQSDLTAQEMKDKLAPAVGPQSTYSGLLLFIMTHGANGDTLYGSDGESVALDELAAIFEADKCPALKDKPKIFILHYCRGPDEELAHREGRGSDSGSDTRCGMAIVAYETSSYRQK